MNTWGFIDKETIAEIGFTATGNKFKYWCGSVPVETSSQTNPHAS